MERNTSSNSVHGIRNHLSSYWFFTSCSSVNCSSLPKTKFINTNVATCTMLHPLDNYPIESRNEIIHTGRAV
uniref:Uncharacterized protein n=1 Tax=Triticum urartu TaxID=4572 RepID=A0A8R7PRV1_TRIUA